MENNKPDNQDESKFDMFSATAERIAQYLSISDNAGAHEDFRTQKAYLDNVYTTIYTFINNMDESFKKDLFKVRDDINKNLPTHIYLKNEISRARYVPQSNEFSVYAQVTSNLKNNLFKYDIMLKELLQKNNLLFAKKAMDDDSFLPE